MTLTEITNLVLDDVFIIVLGRILDFSLTPENEQHYSFSEGEDSLYDRLSVNSVFTKPTLQAMNDELVIYKQELTIEENARLVEVARKDDLKSRWGTIVNRDGGMPSYYQTISGKPNHAIYFKDEILEEPDHSLAESRLATIEAKAVEIQNNISANAWVEGRRKRYRGESDQLFIEAIREKELGNSTKWNTYITLINNIKIEFPKP